MMKVGVDSVLLGSWIAVSGTETNVLDIGTGTGLLALMMAQRISGANITACEIDYPAYKQACENVLASQWNERISVINTDIKVYLQNSGNFDLIICNPPYFENSLKSQNSRKNFARHDDSLSFSELIDCVHKLLSPDGHFALIIPQDRLSSIVELYKQKQLYPLRRLNVQPKENKPVNRIILELSREFRTVDEATLILRNETGYSKDYKALTKDFYR